MAHELHTNDLNLAPLDGLGILQGSMITKNYTITNKPPYRPTWKASNPKKIAAQNNISGGIAGTSPQTFKDQQLGKLSCKNCGAPIFRSNNKSEPLVTG